MPTLMGEYKKKEQQQELWGKEKGWKVHAKLCHLGEMDTYKQMKLF